MPTLVSSGDITISDVNDGLNARLSNESHVIPTDADGLNGDFSGCSTTISVFVGPLDDSVNWTITALASPGLTGTLVGRTYTVTALSGDIGYVDLTAAKTGINSITARFSIAKAKKGVDGSNAVTAILSNEVHSFPADSAGTVLSYANSGTTVSVFEGTTELTYDGVGTSNGTWKITSVTNNITLGSLVDSGNFVTIGNYSAMGAAVDTASASFTITGKTNSGAIFSFTKTQTFSKSKAGVSVKTLEVRSDNANTTGGWKKFIINGVDLIYSWTRGHSMVVLNSDGSIYTAAKSFDTYGDGATGSPPASRADFIAAINAVPSGKIVLIGSFDATFVDTNIRAALVTLGSGKTTTWAAERRSHVLIGQKGLLPGQAVEFDSPAADSTGLLTANAYFTSSGLVANGSIGSVGPSVILVSNRAASFTATDGILDSSQTDLILTANTQGLLNPTFAWSFSGLQTNPTASTTNTQTITAAQFGTSKSAIVTVTVNGTIIDKVTIVRLEKSTAAAGATVGATLGTNVSGQITAGNANTLVAAGALSINKLMIVPVSICPDPYFTDEVWWSETLRDANGWFFESQNYLPVPKLVTLWEGYAGGPGATRKHLWSGKIACPPSGTILRLKAFIRNQSNQDIAVHARFYDKDNLQTGSDIQLLSIANSNLSTAYTAQGVVATNAKTVAFIIYNQSGSTFIGSASVSGIILDIAASADLIVDGAITANKIAANSITTSKLLVTNQGKALNRDPSCSDISAWSQWGGTGSFSVINDTTSPSGLTVIRAVDSIAFFDSQKIPVTGGKQYRISAWAKQSAGAGPMYLRFYCYNSTNAFLSSEVTGLTPVTTSLEALDVPVTWTQYIGYIVAPGTSVYGQIVIHANWTNTGVTDFTDIRVEEFIGADLIVDGSITADKIDSRGLSIKDASGNVILAAGSALPLAYAPSETLNNNVTVDTASMVLPTGFIRTGNTIQKDSGTDSWNTHAISNSAFYGGAYIESTSNGSHYGIGLADNAVPSDYTTIDYWLHVAWNNLYVYENGVEKIGPISCATGDRVGVHYDGQTVRYLKNGIPIYQRGANSAYPLKAVASLYYVGASIFNLQFGPLSVNSNRNLIDTRVWTNGSTGSLPTFNENGPSAGGQNSIQISTLPNGDAGLVWLAKSGTATAANAEGGWTGEAVPIDITKMYRWTVWIKQYGNQTGSFYLGCSNVNNLIDGSNNTNPYFILGARSTLPYDRWCLLVGYTFPYNHGDTTNIGGVYDGVTGQKLFFTPGSFKWRPDVSTTNLRTYQFYTQASNPADPAYQQFWNPRLELCDGTEEPIGAMLAMASTSARNPITASNASTYIANAAIGSAQVGQLTANNIAAGSITADKIVTGEITTSKLSILSSELVNPVSITGNLNGWGGISETGIGTVAGLSYNSTENAIQITSSTSHHVHSQSFQINHDRIYRVAFKIKKSTTIGDFYAGIAAYSTFVDGGFDTSDGQGSINVTAYTANRVVGSTNANQYFQTGPASTSYAEYVCYIIGANRNIADCPAAVNNTGNPYLKVDLSAKWVTLRFLNWSNSASTNLYVKDVSITELGAGQIVADNIDTRGLSIKDASGNIILAAGTPLAWSNVGGTGKPADNATVGAPTGTLVGATLAQTVESNANSVTTKLDKASSDILNINTTSAVRAAGIRVGDIAWDASGVRTSGKGVALTPSGMIGHNGTKTTFAINATTGNAEFGGTLNVSSASTGARVEITNSTIKVYDANGILRVHIGDLTA